MRNFSIDTFRLIAAFAVVCLHAGLPYVGSFCTPFNKMAVPFFFVVSGFYLYSDDRERMEQKIRRGVKHIVKIYASATLVYMLVTYVCWPNDWLTQLYLFGKIEFWIFNIAPFNSVLWYLLAYFYTLLIIGIINRYLKIGFLFYIIPFCLLVNYAVSEFSSFIFGNIYLGYTTNFITMGLPCVLIGMLCKKYELKLPRLNAKSYLLGLFLFYFIAILQWVFIKKITGSGVSAVLFLGSTLPMVVLTLSFCVNHPDFGKKIAKYGNLYSLDIYIYHIMFLWPLLVLQKSQLLSISGNWYKNAIVVFGLTLLFAIFKRRIISKYFK